MTSLTAASGGRARGPFTAGAGCVMCSISLGCGGAFADGALAVLLGALAAAIPVVWVFIPDLVNGWACDRAAPVAPLGHVLQVQRDAHVSQGRQRARVAAAHRGHLSLS